MEELSGKTSRQEKKAKFDPMYIRFHENCTKNFSDTFYAPGQSFDFIEVKVDPRHTKSSRKKTKRCYPHVHLPFLLNLG